MGIETMNLEQLLPEVDRLSPEDRDKLKLHLTQHPASAAKLTVNEWIEVLNAIADEFRGDSTDEEMQEIVAAITTKGFSSEKGLSAPPAEARFADNRR